MDRGALATIVVAIVGGTATLITTQIQETARLNALINQEETKRELARTERREDLRSALIVTAMAAEDPEDRAETLLFFVEVGLIGGGEVAPDAIRSYLESARARQVSVPSISPDLVPRFETVQQTDVNFEDLLRLWRERPR